eukprot:g1325.t1
MTQARSIFADLCWFFQALIFSRFLETEDEHDQRQRYEKWRRAASGGAGSSSAGPGGASSSSAGPGGEAAARDPFEVLGVSREAGDDAGEEQKETLVGRVRRAWKKASLKWHPDRNIKNQEEAKIRQQEINEAYAACLKQLGVGGDSDDEASEPDADYDSDEEAQRMWEELRRAHNRFRKQQKAERRKFARAQEAATRKRQAFYGGGDRGGGRKAPSAGGKAAKRARQRRNNAAASKAAKSRDAVARQSSSKPPRPPRGRSAAGGGGSGVDDDAEPAPSVFETCAHPLAVMVREGLTVLFRSELLLLVRRAERTQQSGHVWQEALDGTEHGNTILHYCAHFGRLEMAMTLVQLASEQWWRCALAKNAAGKTAWGVAIEGSRDAAVCGGYGWAPAARGDEAGGRSRSASRARASSDARSRSGSSAADTDAGASAAPHPTAAQTLRKFQDWEEAAQKEEEEHARKTKMRVDWAAVPRLLLASAAAALAAAATPGLGSGSHWLVSTAQGCLIVLAPASAELSPAFAVLGIVLAAWAPAMLRLLWWYANAVLGLFTSLSGVALAVMAVTCLAFPVFSMVIAVLLLPLRIVYWTVDKVVVCIGGRLIAVPYEIFCRRVTERALSCAFRQVVGQERAAPGAIDRAAIRALPHTKSTSVQRLAVLLTLAGLANCCVLAASVFGLA